MSAQNATFSEERLRNTSYVLSAQQRPPQTRLVFLPLSRAGRTQPQIFLFFAFCLAFNLVLILCSPFATLVMLLESVRRPGELSSFHVKHIKTELLDRHIPQERF